jgi:hypothetical protein
LAIGGWRAEVNASKNQEETSVIATALCDARKGHPDHAMNPEEAKQIAKCIVEALSDAGFQIMPAQKD